ncbi:hypothetical protein BKA58DRAFT_433243 [Alternaria rosae]|uniref:uncharacterized protein n=1 Tax=Alternaria rosae TaxID=1187941 RepID=UPI001E8E5BAB|nr:uncharacterized protein BKA58DRAFT_433243 [Alternaria rosae]KAH6881454.1 hypothetical protein BKA58DRAFT_433243 [Alternaria rosae]
MDVDNIYISNSISYTLQTHGMYLLRAASILTLATLLPRLLGLSHLIRATIFLCTTAYLVFSLHQYLVHVPADEDDTVPPDVDTTPSLTRRGKLTMQTSPTFERVRLEGESTPTKAVVWAKSQAWKNNGSFRRRDGDEKEQC